MSSPASCCCPPGVASVPVSSRVPSVRPDSAATLYWLRSGAGLGWTGLGRFRDFHNTLSSQQYLGITHIVLTLYSLLTMYSRCTHISHTTFNGIRSPVYTTLKPNPLNICRAVSCYKLFNVSYRTSYCLILSIDFVKLIIIF